MTAAIVPAARPELTRCFAESLIRAYGVPLDIPVLLGRRGYYRDTMGVPGQNDRGIYDDAIALVTPTTFRTFNANTDPSITRPGMAVLAAGVWEYRLGIHNASKDPALHPHYLALVQADVVRVNRDGGEHETGYFGINIHRGSKESTSSEGCQTIYPDQWDEFIALVQDELQKSAHQIIPYVLTEREGA